MAKIADFTDPQGWEDWVASRPPVVEKMCRQYPPNLLYLLKPTGQRVTIISYNEQGTVTVDIPVQWNTILVGYTVFGIDPTDLEECELP